MPAAWHSLATCIIERRKKNPQNRTQKPVKEQILISSLQLAIIERRVKKNSNVASFKNVKNILLLSFYLQQRVYQMMSALDKKRCIFLRCKKMYLLPQEGSFGKTFNSESDNHGLKSHITFVG